MHYFEWIHFFFVKKTCFYAIKRKNSMKSRRTPEEMRLVFQTLIGPTSAFANWKSRSRNNMNTPDILSYVYTMQLCVLAGFCPSSLISFLMIITLFKQIKALSFKQCVLWLIIVAMAWGVFSGVYFGVVCGSEYVNVPYCITEILYHYH